ncbi:MAG TPA: carboxypeptidase-like regulatory domain-containing protein [Bryobacteraceae bacterium]|nr:carboxypeptidase-like regulatory domain-containing protein [Bryobacteraceae bacterium]
MTSRTHTILCTALFAASAAAQAFLPQSNTAPVQNGKSSLEGLVVNALTGAPLTKVSLTLMRGGTALGGIKTESDDQGRFAFRDLDPGHYTLMGDKAGYARQAYGARSNPTSGSALLLSAGQTTTDLVFKMSPGAAIFGKVFDEDADPVTGVSVMIARTLYKNGDAQLVSAGSASTNDLGEYRIGGLTSGTYVVFAAKRTASTGLTAAWNNPAPDGPERDYVTTYYPNSLDPTNAAPVSVTQGAEVGGINIRLAKADTFRVRGKVSGGAEGKRTMAMLAPKIGSKSATGAFTARSAVARGDGSFEIAGVTPGEYTLVSFSGDLSSGMLIGSKDLQVGREHVSDVALRLGAGGEVTGSIEMEGPEPADFKNLKVTLNVAPGAVNLSAPSSPVSVGGRFALKDVPSAQYQAQVIGAPGNSYVKSVKYNGETRHDGFTFTGDGGELHITLSPAGAQVEGMVLKAENEPALDATVVLIPASGRSSLYREARTDQKGAFSFKGIAPGEYKALAWEDVETAPYKDPEYLKKVDNSAEALSLKENDHKRVSLKVISPKQ